MKIVNFVSKYVLQLAVILLFKLKQCTVICVSPSPSPTPIYSGVRKYESRWKFINWYVLKYIIAIWNQKHFQEISMNSYGYNHTYNRKNQNLSLRINQSSAWPLFVLGTASTPFWIDLINLWMMFESIFSQQCCSALQSIVRLIT